MGFFFSLPKKKKAHVGNDFLLIITIKANKQVAEATFSQLWGEREAVLEDHTQTPDCSLYRDKIIIHPPN